MGFNLPAGRDDPPWFWQLVSCKNMLDFSGRVSRSSVFQSNLNVKSLESGFEFYSPMRHSVECKSNALTISYNRVNNVIKWHDFLCTFQSHQMFILVTNYWTQSLVCKQNQPSHTLPTGTVGILHYMFDLALHNAHIINSKRTKHVLKVL